MAPVARAWSSGMMLVSTWVLLQDLLVHEPLDFLDLGAVHGGVVGEVEAQAAGLDHAAGLLDVRAEHLAQRGVQQVRGGVVAPGGVAQRRGHFGAQHVAHADGREGGDAVHGQAGHAGEGGLDIGDLLAGIGVESAAVAHLAAGFGVERRLVEDQLGVDACGNLFDDLLLDQQADHAGTGLELGVAQELRAALFEQLLVGGNDRALFGALPTGAGALALLLHLALEAVAVDGEAVLASHVLLLVERQAVGVVELESDGAGNGADRRPEWRR